MIEVLERIVAGRTNVHELEALLPRVDSVRSEFREANQTKLGASGPVPPPHRSPRTA
jgi:hypothetical protein